MPKRGSSDGGKLRPPQPEPVADDEDELQQVADLELSSDDEDADAVGPSGSEDEDDDQGQGAEDIRHAMADYMATAAQARHDEQQAAARRASGQRASTSTGPVPLDDAEEEDELPDGARVLDPGSDSSEDERENRNTVGDVPLIWYKDEDHIGYDKSGQKVMKSARKDRLEQLLDRNDSKKAMRTIYDEYNDEEITLSKDELRMLMAIRKGQFPHVEVNPFEPYNDWFTRDVEKVPFNDAPVPKRRFIPSKHEERKIVKLVRAIRKGWLKTNAQKQAAEEPPAYLLWGEEALGDAANKTGVGLAYIPAAKPKLPGHEQSYNPPAEYLPTEEELVGYELMHPEERPQFIPQAYKSMREVPMYANFIKEVFERCLDLYLCPRVRRKRLHINPEALVPQLPKPADLQPFPTSLALQYRGHTGKVRSVAPDATGQWLLSGADDGCVKLWEVRSGRCMRSWQLGGPVHCVAWCPAPGPRLISAACGHRLVLLAPGVGGSEELDAQAEQALTQALQAAGGQGVQGAGEASGPKEGQLASWNRISGGLEVFTRHPIRYVTWHARGDYFATVAPTGSTQAVLVHQLSKGASQNPFRKNKGRVSRVLFHPAKPFFYVATQNHVRVYNLAKQALAKRLLGGSGSITCMAIHPSGDHVVVGAEDKRLAWYDLDMGDKPYKTLRYHSYALRGAAFHRSYPLFASCSDDGTAQVFHGMVYADLLTNPLLVPLKVLRGHAITDSAGVLDCVFHPTQPWLFTAGADAVICLHCN